VFLSFISNDCSPRLRRQTGVPPMQGPNRLSSHGCGSRSRRLPSNGTLMIDELIDAIDAILNAEDTAGAAPSANSAGSLDANSPLL
jgi:hypothetical protein